MVDSDITTTGRIDWRIDKVANPRQALGGVGSCWTSTVGYRFDNYHISLLKKRGTTASFIPSLWAEYQDFEQEGKSD